MSPPLISKNVRKVHVLASLKLQLPHQTFKETPDIINSTKVATKPRRHRRTSKNNIEPCSTASVVIQWLVLVRQHTNSGFHQGTCIKRLVFARLHKAAPMHFPWSCSSTIFCFCPLPNPHHRVSCPFPKYPDALGALTSSFVSRIIPDALDGINSLSSPNTALSNKQCAGVWDLAWQMYQNPSF